MDNNKDDQTPRPSRDFADTQKEQQRDAYGRDVSEWIDVGGK